MSNYERRIIRDFLPNPDQILTDPDKERAKPREMRTFLQRQRKHLQESMDKTVTQKEKGNLANQIQTVDRVLNLMGNEGGEQEYTKANPASPQTQEDFQSLPEGAVYKDPDDGRMYRKPGSQ